MRRPSRRSWKETSRVHWAVVNWRWSDLRRVATLRSPFLTILRYMAVERPSGGLAQPRNAAAGRRGFAPFAVVIGVVIIAILGTIFLVTLSGDNKQARI